MSHTTAHAASVADKDHHAKTIQDIRAIYFRDNLIPVYIDSSMIYTGDMGVLIWRNSFMNMRDSLVQLAKP